MRNQVGLSRTAPVWVLDGGFDSRIESNLRARFPGAAFPEFHNFAGAVILFQSTPGI
jgi:hypothetical protein